MTQAEQSVTILNGIGAKKAEALARLGLTTLGDLARWYPRAYEDRRKIWPIRQAPEGEPVCVCAVVAQPHLTTPPPSPSPSSTNPIFPNSCWWDKVMCFTAHWS